VAFHLRSTVVGFAGGRGAVTTRFERGGEAREIESDEVCLAVGRRFNPERLGTDRLGLELAPRGLAVTADLSTSVPHVYAAGDAAANHQLT
jgi:pyruvate/2-oxoglutarate dehydrogenase complex dihydrolipoamide dehydrogenase (E3) component